MPQKELFYYLIDETERTFRNGFIVSASVVRVYDRPGAPMRILCRLENGLEASINENDADFFNEKIDVGSVVQGRVKIVESQQRGGIGTDDMYSVFLKCKKSDLRDHEIYIPDLVSDEIEVPQEDKVNQNYNF